MLTLSLSSFLSFCQVPLEDRQQELQRLRKVLEGERRVLICWCRSMNGVRSRVCPCCWMNRRDIGDARDCVCGDAWNS